ncbi:MAG TPA: hypothetical protein VF520_11435 [Thermoleophilaceae bacterium]
MRGLATLAIAAAFVVAAPSSAVAAPGMEVAVQDDSVFVAQSYYKRDKALSQALQLHATRIRVNVLWSAVVGRSARKRKKPRRVPYDFSSYDGIVTAAQARRIKVQMVLTGPAPAWATGNRRVGGYKPSARHYAAFVKAVVAHFKGHVNRYSIWNEPNHVGWLTPKGSAPSIYRSLYKAGYSAAKSADRNAAVLFGELAPFARNAKAATPPLRFLRGVVCVNGSYQGKGCALRADGFAQHPYDFEHGPTYEYPGGDNVTIATLGRLTAALDALASRRLLVTPAGGALDVYLTEFGYMASGKYKVSDARRAEYLVKAFQIAQANPRVRQMLQYLLVQPARKYRFFDTSLLSASGKETGTFRALVGWADAAAKNGQIVSPNQSTTPPPRPPPSNPPPSPPPACTLPQPLCNPPG